MRALALAVAIICCGAGLPATIAAAEDLSVAKRLNRVFARMRSEPDLRANHAACPADIFKTSTPFWYGVVDGSWHDEPLCKERPGECLSACLQGRNMDSCFSLARVVQDEVPDHLGDYAQMLFAQACANGSPGGCTNRGAGIRNGSYPRDPFNRWDHDAAEICMLRTFEASCNADSPWGCTMAGQAHHHGEGTVADHKLARQFYEKACSLNPDFPSCDMAKEKMAELE